MDGYDKLKPYGFLFIVLLMRKSHQNYIAVCIVSLSRYSRKLLWLKVCITNNDPKVVAG